MLGGYDEEAGMPPSSQQDVDAVLRCNEISNQQCLTLRLTPPARYLELGIGSAIPNAVNKKLDRGDAKIANVDPDILQKFPTWAKMKQIASQLLRVKKEEDRYVRNFGGACTTLQEQIYLSLNNPGSLAVVYEEFMASGAARNRDYTTYMF